MFGLIRTPNDVRGRQAEQRAELVELQALVAVPVGALDRLAPLVRARHLAQQQLRGLAPHLHVDDRAVAAGRGGEQRDN